MASKMKGLAILVSATILISTMSGCGTEDDAVLFDDAAVDDVTILDQPAYSSRQDALWYCSILWFGCLMGCDQNHGGRLCEDVCYKGRDSCNGEVKNSE